MIPPLLPALALALGCSGQPPPARAEAIAPPPPPPLHIATDPPRPPAPPQIAVEPPPPRPAPPARVAEAIPGREWPYDRKPRLTPAPVPGVAGAIQIAVSSISSCALRDEGRVICWGNFPVDPTGRVSSIQPAPVWVPVWAYVRGLADGEGAVLALLGDGTVQGHFGVLQNVDHVATFHLGRKYPCALQTNGDVLCWEEHRIGFDPRSVMLRGATQVDSKFHHACALDARGIVQCWGDNGSGQLGDGTTASRARPAPVVGLPPAALVTVGGDHSCALDRSGAVWCWGHGYYGAVGDGTTEERRTPVRVVGIGRAVQVAAGAHHTCALLSDGSVYCWGWNHTGQLGDGTTTDRAVPAIVRGLPQIVQIATYGGHVCARHLEGGKVSCWGDNGLGQIGR